MTGRTRLAGALVVAWAAAALWAYGATVLQPATESALRLALQSPAGDMPDASSYWARDLRWAAILAVLGVVVVLSRGDGRRCAYALVGALVCVGAEVAFDRANPGPSVLVPTVLIACLLVTVAVVAVYRRPGVPGRRLLTVAGAACATTAMAVASLESPTGHAAIVPARLVLLAVLIIVAMSCALTAAPTPGRAPAALAVGAGAVALAAAGSHPVPLLLATVVLLAGVWLLSRSWPGPRRAAAGIAAIVVAYPILAFTCTLVTIDAGRTFTELAGNPAISPADSDMVVALTGALIGVALATARAAQQWLAAELRPNPPAARWLSY